MPVSQGKSFFRGYNAILRQIGEFNCSNTASLLAVVFMNYGEFMSHRNLISDVDSFYSASAGKIITTQF